MTTLSLCILWVALGAYLTHDDPDVEPVLKEMPPVPEELAWIPLSVFYLGIWFTAPVLLPYVAIRDRFRDWKIRRLIGSLTASLRRIGMPEERVRRLEESLRRELQGDDHPGDRVG